MIDERGHQYGRLTVLEFAGVNRHQKIMWLCECCCGTKKSICGGSLRNGLTISCGCYRRENSRRTVVAARKHIRRHS
jgi:hypothetical protein